MDRCRSHRWHVPTTSRRRFRAVPGRADRLLLPDARLGVRGRGRRAGDDGAGVARASIASRVGRRVRSWLYRIATNVCLDMLERARSAAPGRWTSSAPKPSDHAARRRAARGHLDPADARRPRARRRPTTRPRWPSPARRSGSRSSPRSSTCRPRQRAVLILREVLRWKAEEVAELLEIDRRVGQQRAAAGTRDPGGERPQRRRLDRSAGRRAARSSSTATSTRSSATTWTR